MDVIGFLSSLYGLAQVLKFWMPLGSIAGCHFWLINYMIWMHNQTLNCIRGTSDTGIERTPTKAQPTLDF